METEGKRKHPKRQKKRHDVSHLLRRAVPTILLRDVFPDDFDYTSRERQAFTNRGRSGAAHRLERTRLRTRAAATLLARLLVIRDPLDVLRQAFLLAHLLEPPQHLFGGLVAAR